MLSALFPKLVDNRFRGSKLAIWLLAPVVLLKFFQGANVAGFNPLVSSREVLETADRVPVGEFGPEAASHLVFVFAAWGLGIFILGFLGIIVLVRYRGMIPLMYLLLLIEQSGRKVLSTVHLNRPLVSFELSPNNLINWGFLAALVIGFLLSLSTPRSTLRTTCPPVR